MRQERQDDVIQFNLANEQRNAAGDYHEYVTPSTVELVLATWDMDKLDRTAKANPSMFKLRYGFEATTVVRTQVVDFQKRYDLSDLEIRWLKRSGHIRITRTDMRVDVSRTMPILGWAQLVFFSLVVLLLVLQVGFSEAPQWKQGLGFMLLGGFWFGIAWVMLKLYISPWQVLKQAGVVVGASKSNSAPVQESR
ncbi:MAG: hypothetical protein Q7T07_00100 [Burkholderiaceae bacterium]|nr:hypothetical protein [Burkholderiaceae bacterium]